MKIVKKIYNNIILIMIFFLILMGYGQYSYASLIEQYLTKRTTCSSDILEINVSTMDVFVLSLDLIKEIADALINNRLSEMNLNNVRFAGDAEEEFELLLDALQKNKSLTRLVFTNSKLCSVCAIKIIEALLGNKMLRELNLAGNDFFTDGARAIAVLLETNDTLTALDLRNNNIGAEGARVIFDALRNNRRLIRLDLRYNQIGQIGIGGIEAIANFLRTNTTLTGLNIAYNGFNVEGIQIIAEALSENRSLIELDLGGDMEMVRAGYITASGLFMDVAGIRAIAKALVRNTTLQRLHIFRSELIVTERLSKIIKFAIRRNEIIGLLRPIVNTRIQLNLLLGQHPRCGARSNIRLVTSDTLRRILDLVREEENYLTLVMEGTDEQLRNLTEVEWGWIHEVRELQTAILQLQREEWPEEGALPRLVQVAPLSVTLPVLPSMIFVSSYTH